MPVTINLKNWFLSDAGAGIDAAAVAAYVSGTTTPSATTSTDANGNWSFAALPEATYDIGISKSGQVRYRKGGTQEQFTDLDLRDTLQVAGAVSLASTLAVTGAVTLSSTLTVADVIYINDTACANLTKGIVINQGGADDKIFIGKSSDVNHPMTGAGLAEADTFVQMGKTSAAYGGLTLDAYFAAGGTGDALWLRGWTGSAANAVKSTAGYGVVNVEGGLTDGGTGASYVGANGNIFSVRNYDLAMMLVDADGDVWISSDCSALTFTDRTPMPKDLAEAKAAVLSVKRKKDKGDLDHDALHTTIKSFDGTNIGRNLSALVSAQNEVIQDLIAKVDSLLGAHV